MSEEERKKNLYEDLDVNNFIIKEFYYTQKKQAIPEANEVLSLEIKNYSSISGKRMFLPLNILNEYEYVPQKVKNRISDVVVNYAYTDYDTIIYTIPENYIVEYLPDTTIIKTCFGEYKSFCNFSNNKLEYIRIIKRNEGVFSNETYPELIQFYKDIRKADNVKAIFIEKT